MSRPGRRFAACVLLASAAGCAETGTRAAAERQEITVDAEGWAPIENANTLSARHRALAEAQKKAVEKAVGVTLRASTRVDDAVSVKQSIEANVGGTIRRYEVTSEGAEGAFFKVRIRAVVIYRAVEAPLPERSPLRLSVHIASEKVDAAVRDALSSRDYELSADDADADVAVTGMVETRGLADPRLGAFYSYTVKVSLNAANLRSGKVMRIDSEASAVDVDERAACDRALEKAGNESGAALAAGLSDQAFASKIAEAKDTTPPAGSGAWP